MNYVIGFGLGVLVVVYTVGAAWTAASCVYRYGYSDPDEKKVVMVAAMTGLEWPFIVGQVLVSMIRERIRG